MVRQVGTRHGKVDEMNIKSMELVTDLYQDTDLYLTKKKKYIKHMDMKPSKKDKNCLDPPDDGIPNHM